MSGGGKGGRSDAPGWVDAGWRLGKAMSRLGARSAARLVRGSGGDSSAGGGSGEEVLRSVDRVRGDLVELWGSVTGPGADRRLGAAAFGASVGGTRLGLELLTPIAGAGSSAERAADLLFAVEHFTAAALEPLGGDGDADGEDDGDDLGRATVARAIDDLGRDPFTALWRLEGLGHAYGAAFDRRGLDGAFELERLPSPSRMPILTGAGLAVARRRLLGAGGPAEGVVRFFGDCRRRSPGGRQLMMFEAAGFVAHQLLPLRFAAAAEATSSLGAAAVAAFWHGVGRALYLSPRGLADRSGVVESVGRAPGELERRNALAGMVWAATLVHLRRPAHLDAFLAAAAPVLAPDVVEHGVDGALTVWLHHRGEADTWAALGEDPPASLLAHRGASGFWPSTDDAVERAGRRVEAIRGGGATWDGVYTLDVDLETGASEGNDG